MSSCNESDLHVKQVDQALFQANKNQTKTLKLKNQGMLVYFARDRLFGKSNSLE